MKDVVLGDRALAAVADKRNAEYTGLVQTLPGYAFAPAGYAPEMPQNRM